MTNYVGTAGADSLNGGSSADLFEIQQGGRDTVVGGGGDDTIQAGGALTAADSIVGGAGTDTLRLSGDYSAGLTLANKTLTSIEWVFLSGAHDYNLTLAADDAFALTAQDVGSDNSVVVDASAVKSASLTLIDGQGDDVLIGGGGGDTLVGRHGGKDTLRGADGDDRIHVGATFTGDVFVGGDRVDGGAGYDVLQYQGPSNGGTVSLSGAAIVGIEEVIILDGPGAVRLLDSLVAPSADLFKIYGQRTHVDASAERDAGIWFAASWGGGNRIEGGGGNDRIEWDGPDTLIGGRGDDVFVRGEVAQNSFQARVDGGAGRDALHLEGVGNFDFLAWMMTGIEDVWFGSNDYIEFDDSNVAAGKLLTVHVSSSLETYTLINGSAEVDGRFSFVGGEGDETLIGGDGADVFNGGGDTDLFAGLGGADRYLFATIEDIGPDPFTILKGDRIEDLEAQDVIDLRAIDANQAKAGNQAFRLVDVFTNKAGQGVISYDPDEDISLLTLDVDGDGEGDGWVRMVGDHLDFTNFLL